MVSPLRVKNKLFYGWVVVATFFIFSMAVGGMRVSFGVFFKSIQSEFELSRTITSAIVSVSMLLGGSVFAALGGWALDKYGPSVVVLFMGLLTGLSLLLTSLTNSAWQLFITYSVLLAAGTGAMFVVPMSAVSRWFNKKRALALGIAGAGGGLGQAITAPFATFLIARFDWRMAFLIMGLIVWLVAVPVSRLLKRGPSEIGVLPDGEKSDSITKPALKPKAEVTNRQPVGLTVSQAFRTRSFWLWVFATLFMALSFLLLSTHIVPHATDVGFSTEKAAIILSIMGASTIAGRVVLGILADRMGRKATTSICFLVQGLTMVWLLWAQELWAFYLFALVYGWVSGGLNTAMAALAGDIFGLANIGVILGVLEPGFAIGAALGPVLGGYIFDLTNSYSLAFSIGAVAMVIGALLFILVRRETDKFS